MRKAEIEPLVALIRGGVEVVLLLLYTHSTPLALSFTVVACQQWMDASKRLQV